MLLDRWTNGTKFWLSYRAAFLCLYLKAYLAWSIFFVAVFSVFSIFSFLSLFLYRFFLSFTPLSLLHLFFRAGRYDELFMNSIQEQVESTTLERPDAFLRCPIHIQTYSSYRAGSRKKKELTSELHRRNEFYFRDREATSMRNDIIINEAIDNDGKGCLYLNCVPNTSSRTFINYIWNCVASGTSINYY